MSIDSQDSWWKHTGLKLLDSTSGQDYSMYQQCRTEHLDISQHTRKNIFICLKCALYSLISSKDSFNFDKLSFS